MATVNKLKAATPQGPVTPFPTMRLDDRDFAVIREVRELQETLGLSNGEVARRAEIAGSTFSEVIRGVYAGNARPIIDRLEKWVRAEVARLETQSAGLPQIGFVQTSMAREMIVAMRMAQTRPAMVLLTLGSGLGKTETLRWYEANHINAIRVVIEPIEGRARAALRKIAAVVGVSGFHTLPLAAELKRRLSRQDGRQHLLMIDEAQNLDDDAVNQLRFLLDEAQCGIALAGNDDLMARYRLSASREGYGQIHRRIFMRVHHRTAPQADVDMMVAAFRIDDPAILRLCRQIGQRAGGLGQVVDTLDLATQTAFGKQRALAADDVREAWANRSREELR